MNLECFRVKPDSGLSQVLEKAMDSWVVLGCFGQAVSHAPIKSGSLAPMDHLSLAPTNWVGLVWGSRFYISNEN